MKDIQKLSKLKKQDIIGTKKAKAIDAEKSLSEDPSFKKKHTAPSSKVLSSEEFLADLLKAKEPKSPASKKLDAEKSLADDTTVINPKKGNKKLDAENSLSESIKRFNEFE